jgi:hypothetical protein
VIGALKAEGLLEATAVAARKTKSRYDDFIWVGEMIEPRVLELLLAIVLKRPSLILGEVIDDEIEKVMLHLQERDSDFEFRGVRGSLILKWLTRLASKESV